MFILSYRKYYLAFAFYPKQLTEEYSERTNKVLKIQFQIAKLK